MRDPQELQKEKRIIEAAQKDTEEFIKLYDKYFDHIYRYVMRRTGNDQDTAHDLVSQTFLDALANIGKFEWKGYPFSSWLYKIAHNNVIKWYKKEKKNMPLDGAQELKDEGKDQREKMDTKIAQHHVQKILSKLDVEEREILRLKFFEGVSNVEIAEIMDLSVSNVGVKVFRTLKKAKGLLPAKLNLKNLT